MDEQGSTTVRIAPARPLTDTHGSIMFAVTVLFLAALAVLLQWLNSTRLPLPESNAFMVLMGLLWAPFVAEALVGLVRAQAHPGQLRRFLLISLLPPFRLGYSTFHPPDVLWVPSLGWAHKDQALTDWLEGKATRPMLVIALLILPLLGVEFLLKDEVAAYPWLGLGLELGAGFIWLAFAFEFTLMLSVTNEKIAYCKQHWINILIILMPLLAFLRNVQAIRALRAAQSTHFLRVYRLRGVLMRLRHALVALSAIERLLYRNPEKLEKKLMQQRQRLHRDLAEIEARLVKVRREVSHHRIRRSEAPQKRWLGLFGKRQSLD